MKKTRIFFLCVISFFIVISCTKTGKNITLKGKVVNPITGEPISGQKIVFYKGEISLEWSSGWKIIKETYSDENGDFETSALRIGEILARKDGFPNDGTKYYDLGWDYNGSYHQALKLDKGRKMYADYHLVPYGKIKISFKNVNCQGVTDTLILDRVYQNSPSDNVFLPMTFTGCFENEGEFATVPSGNYKITWTVIRNGNEDSFSHMLFVPGNGEASYHFDY